MAGCWTIPILIDILQKSDAGTRTSTIEIVLSSLVGVGIGGLIAIARQLVQDSGNSSGQTLPRTDNKEKEDSAGPALTGRLRGLSAAR